MNLRLVATSSILFLGGQTAPYTLSLPSMQNFLLRKNRDLRLQDARQRVREIDPEHNTETSSPLWHKVPRCDERGMGRLVSRHCPAL